MTCHCSFFWLTTVPEYVLALAQVNSNTLIVFIAPNRLCDYETLLHQNARQHAVFPIAHKQAIIPLRATVGIYIYIK